MKYRNKIMKNSPAYKKLEKFIDMKRSKPEIINDELLDYRLEQRQKEINIRQQIGKFLK